MNNQGLIGELNYSSTRIMSDNLTNAEYAVLGLLMERPSHGYDLEKIIQTRGMREWTELAFSSIYFILNRLEKRGLAESQRDPTKRTRKIYGPTQSGKAAFQAATEKALAIPHPLYPSVLLGLSNWQTAPPGIGMKALGRRLDALIEIQMTVEAAARGAPVVQPHVNAVFDYSLTQLRSEIEWLQRTMKNLGETNEQD